MQKNIFLLFVLILFISCDNGVILDNICLYSESSAYIGTNAFSKQKTESIVYDRRTNKFWNIQHTDKKIIMKDFFNPDICIELKFEDGVLNYLYEDYLFDGKYISRAIVEGKSKIVIFDIFNGLYNLIDVRNSQPYRICGLDNNYIYIYLHNKSIIKINYLTLEEEVICFDLFNPGYCIESKSFIGITDKNNICIVRNGVKNVLPVKGIRYNSNSGYVDISNLYYNIGNKIYYAKKDIIGYIKGIFSLAIFLDGLGPVKWYCYDIETNKSVKINNKGYSFLCEFK